MRIHEIVTEAISATQYYHIFKKSIQDGLIQAVLALHVAEHGFPRLERLYDHDDQYPLMGELAGLLKRKFIPEILPKIIKTDINKALGSKAVTSVKFGKMPGNTEAYVTNNAITISLAFADRAADSIVNRLLEIAYPYDDGVSGMFQMIRDADSDEWIRSDITDAVANDVNTLSSNLVHELVHVIQHDRQKAKGRTKSDYEYRSYLDNTKDEFRNMSHDYMRGKDSKIDSTLYSKLYMASPQEMSAFAHNIVLDIITLSGLDHVSSMQQLIEIVKKIDAKWIVKTITNYIQDKFRNPEDKKEYEVFKRYVKLVYQELNRYIDTVKVNLK